MVFMKVEFGLQMQNAHRTEFELGGYPVQVYTTDGEGVIDVSNEYTVSRGPLHYAAVVVFGKLLEARGMSGSEIPVEQRWTKETLPQGVETLEFHPEHEDAVSQAAASAFATLIHGNARTFV